MESVPQVQTTRSTGGGSDGSDGNKVWTITGVVQVRESEIDGGSHDRELKGIEVKVSASDVGADGPWTQWGTVRTEVNGHFTLEVTNNGRTRFFRVEARLHGDDLVVKDGTIVDVKSLDLFDGNWRTIWKSQAQLEGPNVSVGTRVIAAGQSFDLGDATFRRAALVWYVLRSAIDRLEAEDGWFAIAPSVVAIYPADSITGASYEGSDGKFFLEQTDPTAWHPEMVLYWLMLQWHDHHTHGSRKISGFPNAFFAFGFAAFAANALMHELWGSRLELPFNRRAVAKKLELSTLDEIENSEAGVKDALRFLRCERRHGWWSGLFGTALEYPDDRPDSNGDGVADYPDEVGVKEGLGQLELPSGPDHLSLWDILRTFRADPAKDWPTDLEVGKDSDGILQFIDRAVDIHGLGDDVRVMIKSCLDPLATDEPYEHLTKVITDPVPTRRPTPVTAVGAARPLT
jgi:hypothetical protein